MSWSNSMTRGLLLAAFVMGSYLLLAGLWIPTKAMVAQQLIERVWQQNSAGSEALKPWPWADTWPVARLQAQRGAVDLYVLEGGHGQALAFGPGRIVADRSASGEMGTGVTIIAGHRDTHFGFLEALRQGESITLTDHEGNQHRYRVHSLSVEDSAEQLLTVGEQDQLVLVTCYPFNAVTAGGSLRYVVRASAEARQSRALARADQSIQTQVL